MKRIAILLLSGVTTIVSAQTDYDGIRMSKNNFCGGIAYTYNQFDHYWEGTFRRSNENIGAVSSSSIVLMGAYGVLEKLNVLFYMPFIATNASAGTLKGQQGLQDLNIFLKYLTFSGGGESSGFQVYSVLGGSTPVSNYIPDFLPLSIGVKSPTVSMRLIGDYEFRNFFVTASGSYVHRFNINIERPAYYTDRMIYSHEVYMPDVFTSRLGFGFRKGELIIEGAVDHWNTLGGFDIRKNDMPFPSNNMDMTRAGVYLKVPIEKISGLSFTGNLFYTLDGRNAGQSFSAGVGVLYIISLKNN